MKVGVKIQVAKEREEVESDICSVFVFTLWKAHPDLNFFCFGEEVVEAVKKYAIDVASS